MSIENDIEENKRRIELLKLARHMLNEQYLKDRADAYVQWSAQSDQVWKEQGVKLPFPPTPSMPSEADIVAKALELYNHINAPKQQEQVAKEEPVEEKTPETKIEEKTPEPKIEEKTPEPEEEKIVELPKENIDVTSNNITQPTISTVNNIISHGAADMDVAESAIKEIFTTPAVDPTLVPAELIKSQSVVPLIKGLLKKGLLPNWVKPDDDIKGTQ